MSMEQVSRRSVDFIRNVFNSFNIIDRIHWVDLEFIYERIVRPLFLTF